MVDMLYLNSSICITYVYTYICTYINSSMSCVISLYHKEVAYLFEYVYTQFPDNLIYSSSSFVYTVSHV